jgi:Uma2 family endonuclease
MSPSYQHESYAAVIGRFIDILTEELDIPVRAGRCTTFRREDVERGLEADNCYYIRNAELIAGKTGIDLTRDPPPDLTIEVDISRSWLDRMGIYAQLRIPEAWRFDGKAILVYRLGEEGKYEILDFSPLFPFLPVQEVTKFLQQSASLDNTALAKLFRAWVREHVLPASKNCGYGRAQES